PDRRCRREALLDRPVRLAGGPVLRAVRVELGAPTAGEHALTPLDEGDEVGKGLRRQLLDHEFGHVRQRNAGFGRSASGTATRADRMRQDDRLRPPRGCATGEVHELDRALAAPDEGRPVARRPRPAPEVAARRGGARAGAGGARRGPYQIAGQDAVGDRTMEATETITRREPADLRRIPTEADVVFEREIVGAGMWSLVRDRLTELGPERTLWVSERVPLRPAAAAPARADRARHVPQAVAAAPRGL